MEFDFQRCVFIIGLCVLLINTVTGGTRNIVAGWSRLDQTVNLENFIDRDQTALNYIIIRSLQSAVFTEVTLRTSKIASASDDSDCGWVKLYSGLEPHRQYIGSYCGGLSNQDFAVYDKRLTLILDYDAIKLEDLTIYCWSRTACGGTLSAWKHPRFLRSPQQVAIFSDWSDCRWTIIAPLNQRVRVAIRYTGLNVTTECGRTTVSVSDRTDIATWCAGTDTYVSWSHVMILAIRGLQFSHDTLEIEYSTISGGAEKYSIDGDSFPSGVIKSPEYPNPYNSFVESRWKIHTSGYKNIHLKFDQIHIGVSENCTEESVQLYTSSTIDSRNAPLYTLCGSESSSYDFYSRLVHVVFRADLNNETRHTGFKMSYEVSYETKCGANYTAEDTEKIITSVGYPAPFPGFQQCKWVITAASPDKMVVLTVTHSDLTFHYTCDDQSVRVYDGPNEHERRIGEWCDIQGRVYRSGSRSMTVLFTSAIGNTYKTGFSANYKQADCRFDIQVKAGERDLYSPSAIGGLRCVWHLSSVEDIIAVRFSEVDVDCDSSDSLIIKDGFLHHPNQTWSVCGTGDHSYLSRTKYITIEFNTVSANSGGFQLAYQRFTDRKGVSRCSGEIEEYIAGPATEIMYSPGYPGLYYDELSCSYRFTTAYSGDKTRVKLSINIIDMQQRGTECVDFIRVHDGYDQRARVRYPALCFPDFIVNIISSGQYMYLTFQSDASVTGRGFKIYYSYLGDAPSFVPVIPESTTQNWEYKPNAGIIVGALVPGILILGLTIMVVVCIKCRKKPQQSSTGHWRHEISRENVWNTEIETNNMDRPAPPPTVYRPSAPPAPPVPPIYTEFNSPPPSYDEIEHFPVKPDDDNSNLPPPPSYTDVLQGNNITLSNQNTTSV